MCPLLKVEINDEGRHNPEVLYVVDSYGASGWDLTSNPCLRRAVRARQMPAAGLADYPVYLDQRRPGCRK